MGWTMGVPKAQVEGIESCQHRAMDVLDSKTGAEG